MKKLLLSLAAFAAMSSGFVSGLTITNQSFSTVSIEIERVNHVISGRYAGSSISDSDSISVTPGRVTKINSNDKRQYYVDGRPYVAGTPLPDRNFLITQEGDNVYLTTP